MPDFRLDLGAVQVGGDELANARSAVLYRHLRAWCMGHRPVRTLRVRMTSLFFTMETVWVPDSFSLGVFVVGGFLK